MGVRTFLPILFALAAAAAHADQDAVVKGAVMQRDQMSEDLARSIRQDRARLGVPSSDVERNRQLDQLFIQQNQDADNRNAQQQLDMRLRRGAPRGVQPEYDYQRFQAERRSGDAAAQQQVERLQREQREAAERREPLRYTPTLQDTPKWGPRL
jgi:hypothetical protein